ncbi:hypothetical protein [Spiroplasma endosymbiont of Virgichneumon dumeticola]|uniref:hypothetical protein n=1 Tax=Spiroplasma endosymbiont of Virgichneumon dumeticola TaxID=3139323 RepID=UPI0035C8B287
MSKKETTSRWMLCGIIKTDKTDLKTKLTTLTIDFNAKTDKINKELSENIMYAKEVNGLNPSLVNPIITFFSDAQGKNNITSQKQKAGDLYVVISTSVNDLNYKGSTNPIKIMIK